MADTLVTCQEYDGALQVLVSKVVFVSVTVAGAQPLEPVRPETLMAGEGGAAAQNVFIIVSGPQLFAATKRI